MTQTRSKTECTEQPILDQGQLGASTSFGVANAILLNAANKQPSEVKSRLIYYSECWIKTPEE